MRRSFFIHTLLFFLFISFFAILVDARSGCCSYHNGVRADGCGCNDGTPLSSTCAPYYQCNSGRVTPTNTPIPLPTWTPVPTYTPIPSDTPTPTVTITPKPTKIISVSPKAKVNKVSKTNKSNKQTVKKKTFLQRLFNR